MKDIVYMFTNYQGKKYIGSKVKCRIVDNKILDENDSFYWTSSSYNGYKESLQTMPYKLDILFECETGAECIIKKERELQIKYKVVEDPSFVNKVVADSNVRKWVGKKKRKIYNNGIVQVLIIEGEEIPEGFVRGRLKKSIETQKQTLKRKRTLYHNPETNIEVFVFGDDEPPKGFIVGMSPLRKERLSMVRNKLLKNSTMCVNDDGDIINVRKGEEIPEGFRVFKKGSLSGKGGYVNHSGTKKYINDEGVIRFFKPDKVEEGFKPYVGSSNIAGKTKYHNPKTKVEIYLNKGDEIPEGFIKGGLKRKKRKNTFYNVDTLKKGMYYTGEEPDNYKRISHFSSEKRKLIREINGEIK